MGEPLKLGRKVLVVLLIVVLLGSSLYPPGGYVKAAPFIPGGTAEPLPGTLEGLIKARTGKIAGYHVDEDRIVPTERALQKSPQAPQGSSGNSYGIVGLGVWESPNRVLLRWTPNNGWIPKDGYTLVRLVDGEPTPLASGLGTANPVYLSASQGLTLGSQSSSSGGTGTNGTVGKSGTGGAIQQPGAVTPPKLPGTTPASPSKVLQLGDQTVSTEEFVSSIQESTNVTEEVRQTLRQRNVLGSDQSDAAVEQAVSSYQAQVAPPAANKVISGREAFISRLQAALETPNKPTLAAPVMNALPTALNRSELSQISAPRLAPTAPSGQTTTQAPPPDDSVSRMLTARRDLLTTTNLNFSSAVAAGLGFIDTLPKLNAWQRDIQYLIIPNRELASYTIKANKPSPQIEVQVGQPMALSSPANLEGYGLDGRVALRWDDPDDLLSRSIVSGFSVERKLASETSFRTVNPNNPVVRMYSRDGQGNLFEAETLYTDTLANGLSATYQIRALDIFGRLSEPSTPIAISVLKTTPPPTPGLEQPELMTIERKPIDLAALKTSAPSIEFGAPNGLAGGLNKPALIDPDTKRREEELERDQQLLEARKQAIRDRHPGQPGIMLHFDHSFEEKVPASKSSASTAQPLVSEPHYTLPEGLERQLAEGLSEYHIYRSEALGKGAFSTPTLIATVSLATLSGAYGSVQDLDSGLLYYDPSIKPGYYYAYWVTAQDSWGNESPFQSKPQVIGYPTTAKPGSPQGLENQFEVNPDLIAEQPKIAGFSERLKIKLPAPATLPGGTTTPSLRGSVPGSSLTGKSSHDLDDFIIKRDIHRVVVAQADEVRPDGSLTVGWLPTTKADVIGYQVYRAHDPAATTVTEPLTEDDLDRYQWTLINVNTDPEKRDQLEAQVTTSNQLRDTVPLPARGSYYYLVYLIKADTFASSQASADEETPYVEGGKVVLQWGQVNDPQLAGYRVYRAEVPAPSATATNAAQELRWDIIAQLIDGCEYTDVVDQSKVHYYQYKVSAISIWGVESAATVAAAPVRISTTIPPLVPTFLTPIAQPGQVQLRWKPVHDATRYTIYRSKVQIPKIKTVDLVAALRAAGVSGADQMNEEEALQWVEEKTASLSEVQKRAVLAEVKKRFGVLALAPYSALDRETAAEIQWVPINSQDISLADNELRANSGEVMIWTDNSVDYPHSYMYSIEAINEDRLSSGLSSPVTSGPLKAIGPSAPEPLTINIANNAVKLAWSAYTSHTPMGYLVFRASAEDGVYQQCSPLLATPEFSEPWNSVQSTWYRVVIIDEVGLMSAATKPVQASAMATNLPQGFDTPGPSGLDKGKGNLPGSLGLPLRGMAVLKPQAPLLSAGEITGTTVSLSWTAGSGIDQYEVYGYRTEQPEELMGTVDGKTSTYTVTGLKPSTQYYFYIKAKNRLGEAISNVGSAKTKSGSATPAPAVGNLTLTVTETTASSVKLAWTNTGSAPANYKVYCYKTEQPEQLLATLSGSSLAYTALSLTANTKYFFYVVAVGADGKPVVTSNVASAIAKPTAPLPTTPTTLPGTIRVAGYTIERVKEVPLVTMTNPNGTQIVGELVVPGLAPLAVKLSVQELRGDTLVKGSVALGAASEQSLDGSRLFLSGLTLDATGPAKVTGRLAIPSASTLTLSNTILTPEGSLQLGDVAQLELGDYRLRQLTGVTVTLTGQRSLKAGKAQLETQLGQITTNNEGILLEGSNLALDFAGKLTGSFRGPVLGQDRLILVVPRAMHIQVTDATLKIDQGVVDRQSSHLNGQALPPFIEGEMTSVVDVPVASDNHQRPGADQEAVVNPADMMFGGQRFNFRGLTELQNVADVAAQHQQKLILDGSVSYLLSGLASSADAAPSNSQASASNSTKRMAPSTITTTILDFGHVDFSLDQWNGQGIMPSEDQVGAMAPVLVKELKDRSAIRRGGGSDKSDLLQLEANKLKLSFPIYRLQTTPEDVRNGGPGYRGFEIIEGFVTLPPSSVELRNPASDQGSNFRLPVPASTLFYSRNGLLGHIDTEATSGETVDIYLNEVVEAIANGLQIDIDASSVQWSMTGVIPVAQLPTAQNQARMLEYAAFSDPQGGLLFSIQPEALAPNPTGAKSIRITGGTLKGADLYLDGVMNVDNGQIKFRDMAFVGLKLYMGNPDNAPSDPGYGQALAATPVSGKVKDFNMQAEGLKVEKGENGWETFVTGATALANNLPLNKGTVLNLDTNLDTEKEAFTAKLNFTYEQFLTIDISVKYENKELRGEGEFWFITGAPTDKERAQAAGSVQARIGTKDVEYEEGGIKKTKTVDYWLFRVAYGQTLKVWKCGECESEFKGSHPPTKCPFTGKNGQPCTGDKDDFKQKFECKECKKVIYVKKAPEKGSKCSGTEEKACWAIDSYKEVLATADQSDAKATGLMLGPVQVNNIMGMVGYNVELPMDKKTNTFDIPQEIGIVEKLYDWKISANDYKFFAARAVMTIWHDGEKFLVLDPVKLVVASGPSVEMEVGIKRDNKLLVWGKIGYYHADERYFLAVKIPELKLPSVGCGLKDLNLLLDFSPKKQIVNLSYPEMVKVIITGSPWDFAGGFAYENNDGKYAIRLRARVQYGYEGEYSIFYVKAKAGLTVDAQIDIDKEELSFILMMLLEAQIKAGITVRGKPYEILNGYLALSGFIGKTKTDDWWIYGRAYVEYHIDLWLFEASDWFEWTLGKLPEGMTPEQLPKDNRTPRESEQGKDKGKEGDKGKAA